MMKEEKLERNELVDDEDVWLEALERGELDDNGEIPKTRDPSLMTARQRALLNRGSSSLIEEVVSTSKEETEEERKKRLEKNRRRKLQAVKKAKETQKETIRRLIEIPKTNKDKAKSSASFTSGNKVAVPTVKYTNNALFCTISYPDGHSYPLQGEKCAPPPPKRSCAVCGETRKYACSKTGVPLCSLNCYKENFKNRS